MTLRRVARLLKPYQGAILLVLVAVLVSALLGVLPPFFTRAIFDRALFPTDGSGPQLGILGWLVLAMIIVPVITSIISIGQNYLTSKVGNSAMADLRSQLFDHLQTMELGFFTATRTGAIQSRLANDVAGVRTVLTDTATTILQNSVTIIAAISAMVVLSWELTIITLIFMPVFIAVQIRVGRRRRQLARKAQESLAHMTAITEETLSVSGILLGKVFNQAANESLRYREANDVQTRLQVRQAMTGRLYFALVQTSFAVTPALIYLAAGFMLTGRFPVGGDTLTAGTLVAFTTLQANLQLPLMRMMRVTLDVQTSMALFARIFEYLDLEPAIRDRPGAHELTAVRGEVEFDDVWFRYPPPRGLQRTALPANERSGDQWALREVTLRVEPGQFAALVGPSGAGKTTLAYLVPRLYDVTRGAVRIDGHDVREVTLDSLAHAVGMVTQDTYLFHGTVRDNIRYARPDATDAEIEQAARDANIHDVIMSFADGYDTITGERGYRLSGGEKQRLAIARVLLKDPPIIILDEATSALDTATERLVQEALDRASSGRTTIAIAHRLSTIQQADVIFVVDGGRIVERGSHSDLLAAGGLYARLHAEQLVIEHARVDG